MTNTYRRPQPQISAALCAQLSEAIKTVLSTSHAAEAALAKYIYEHGPQVASIQAQDAASEAQLALWTLLYSNSARDALVWREAGEDQDEDSAGADDLSDEL